MAPRGMPESARTAAAALAWSGSAKEARTSTVCGIEVRVPCTRRRAMRLTGNGAGFHLLDVGIRVARFAEKVGRVLPALRGSAPHGPRRIRELRADADVLDRPELRVLYLGDHLTRLNVGVLEHFIQRVDGADADIALPQLLEPLSARPLFKAAAEIVEDLGVLFAVHLLGDVVLTAEGLTDLGPEPESDAADA